MKTLKRRSILEEETKHVYEIEPVRVGREKVKNTYLNRNVKIDEKKENTKNFQI